MNPCRPRRLLPVVLGPVLLVAAPGALGAPKSSPGALAAVIGPDAPLVVELSGGGRLVDRALESSLWRRLRATPEVEAALRTTKARRARSGLAMFAGLLERTPEEAVRAVLGREVAAAITPRGEGDATAILAVRFERPADAERLAEVWHHFLTLVAEGEGYDDTGVVRTVDGKEFHAVRGDCFLLGNDREAVEAALGRLEAEQDPAAAPQATDPPRLVAHADLEWLRRAKPSGGLPERTDNALVALLGHGFAAAANRATSARAEFALTGEGLAGTLFLDGVPPDDAAWSMPLGAPPPAVEPPEGTIAALTLRRDLTEFYERRRALLDPSLEEKLVEFDNVISIFFGGRSFGEEVLPALGERVTLIVGPQDYDALPSPPDVRLPGFTLVVPVDADALSRSDLMIAFQTTIGLVNADRAQKGLAALMLSTERVDGVDVQSARFLLEDDEEARELRMNASPALAVVEGRLVLGSARDHVLAVVDAIRHGAAPGPPAEHARFDVRGEPLRVVLAENREALVANRMLEQGETREEADAFWARADRVLSLLGRFTLALDHAQGGTTLRLAIVPRAEDEAEDEG